MNAVLRLIDGVASTALPRVWIPATTPSAVAVSSWGPDHPS
jgi:hypothetical protein